MCTILQYSYLLYITKLKNKKVNCNKTLLLIRTLKLLLMNQRKVVVNGSLILVKMKKDLY